MAKVSVIANKNARGLRGKTGLVRALSGLPCRVVSTQSLGELDACARELVADRTDVVVLAGGDGSVMEGMSALARAARDANAELPKIAIAPAGTFSTIATNLGLRRATVPHLRALVAAASTNAGTAKPHATLRVRDAAGGDRLGFIFGSGLIAQFFELYDRLPAQAASTKLPVGLSSFGMEIGAISLIARLFFGAFTKSELAARVLSPVPLRLTLGDDTPSFDRYSLVVSSVLRDLGLHLRPTWRAGSAPERVHVVASTRSAANLAFQLPFVLAERPLQGTGHVDAVVPRFRVTFDGDLRSYVLDGDRLVAGPRDDNAWVDVEAGPDVPFFYV